MLHKRRRRKNLIIHARAMNGGLTKRVMIAVKIENDWTPAGGAGSETKGQPVLVRAAQRGKYI